MSLFPIQILASVNNTEEQILNSAIDITETEDGSGVKSIRCVIPNSEIKRLAIIQFPHLYQMVPGANDILNRRTPAPVKVDLVDTIHYSVDAAPPVTKLGTTADTTMSMLIQRKVPVNTVTALTQPDITDDELSKLLYKPAYLEDAKTVRQNYTNALSQITDTNCPTCQVEQLTRVYFGVMLYYTVSPVWYQTFLDVENALRLLTPEQIQQYISDDRVRSTAQEMRETADAFAARGEKGLIYQGVKAPFFDNILQRILSDTSPLPLSS